MLIMRKQVKASIYLRIVRATTDGVAIRSFNPFKVFVDVL